MQTVPSCHFFHLVLQRPNSVLFLAQAQHEVHNDPYLLFTLKLVENPATARYWVTVGIQASTPVPAALVTEAGDS